MDSQQLLTSFRDMNTSARDLAKDGEPDDSLEYVQYAREFSHEAATAAEGASNALLSLDKGDPTPARQYLDSMAHVMGMMSLATHVD